jgi:hypothetical protein
MPREIGSVMRDAGSFATGCSRDAWPPAIAGIELVWHRLNRRHDMARFLRSGVRWAECDARISPSGAIVASHSPGTEGDGSLEKWLDEVAAAGRAAKIDLKEGGPVLDEVIAIVGRSAITGNDLWFNAAPEVIGGRPGFEALTHASPRARRSIPLDTLAAWLQVSPRPALAMLADARSWGVNRLSISVQTQTFQEVIGIVATEGWLVNVWDVSDGAQLRDAIEAAPSSITADLGILEPPVLPHATAPAPRYPSIRSASRTAAPPGSLLK